jgi:hypothetical protein
MDIITLTGLTMDEVSAKLQATLPADAYTALPGAANLTDINPAYLWETLTACFGLAGYGWFYKKGGLVTELVGDGTKKSDWTRAMFDDFTLFYRLNVNGEIVTVDGIESNGASENADFSYAVRGATTNALGGAARMLLWQLQIYKGQGQDSPPGEKAPRSSASRNDGKPADFIIPFGKFKGQTVAAVYANRDENGAEYLDWLRSDAFEAKNDTGKRAKIAAASYLASQSGPAPEPKHWIDDPNVRARFWAWTGDLGLSNDEVHAALMVESVKDFGGTMAEAKSLIETWLEQHAGAEPQDDEPF